MSSPQDTPPGWYPNQDGEQQWWDGKAWGPVAPQPVRAQQRTVTYAMPYPQMKSTGVAYVLLIFLGGLGAHHFYLNHTGRAIAQLLLWIFGVLPSIFRLGGGNMSPFTLLAVVLVVWLVVDLFTLAGEVREYNQTAPNRFVRPVR